MWFGRGRSGPVGVGKEDGCGPVGIGVVVPPRTKSVWMGVAMPIRSYPF